MIYGLNTFLLTSPFTNESINLFPLIRKWGFDSVELALEDPLHIDTHIIKSALDDNGLVCGSICAVMGPGRDLRGSHNDQQASLNYLNSVIDIMNELQCPVLAGPLYSSVGRASQIPPEVYNQQWELVSKHLSNLAAYAANAGVQLAIEPLNRYETDFINTTAQAMQMIKSVNSPALGVHLDSYHMNIEEKDPADAIRMAGEKLFHFHACGCDRGTPGSDHINWNTIGKALREINYQGNVVIESFTPDVTVIARAASIWRQVESSQEEIARKGLKFLNNTIRSRS